MEFGIQGVLAVEDTRSLDDWEELLGPPPPDLDCFGLLRLAVALSLQEYKAAVMPQEPQVEVMQAIGDLRDRIDSNSSLQIPILDLLDRIARRTEETYREISDDRRMKAEASLRASLGEQVYDSLHPEARLPLLSAEYVLHDQRLPDPTQIVASMALAFECQLRAAILRPFCEHLRQIGVQDFPRDGDQFLLMRRGKRYEQVSLERILRIMDRGRTELHVWLKEVGLDFSRVRWSICEVKDVRNRADHEGGLGREYARQLHDQWLKPGGIFAVLTRRRVAGQDLAQ